MGCSFSAYARKEGGGQAKAHICVQGGKGANTL